MAYCNPQVQPHCYLNIIMQNLKAFQKKIRTTYSSALPYCSRALTILAMCLQVHTNKQVLYIITSTVG